MGSIINIDRKADGGLVMNMLLNTTHFDRITGKKSSQVIAHNAEARNMKTLGQATQNHFLHLEMWGSSPYEADLTINMSPGIHDSDVTTYMKDVGIVYNAGNIIVVYGGKQ